MKMIKKLVQVLAGALARQAIREAQEKGVIGNSLTAVPMTPRTDTRTPQWGPDDAR